MGPDIVTGKERSARGFTLIELIVVMTILVTLATIGLVQYRQSIVFARESVLKDDLFKMKEAIDQYYADKNKYPADLPALVGDKYIRAVPVDPFTQSTETWQTVTSDPDPLNPNAAPGISDVKSGSENNAIDGTKYADW